MIAADVVMSNFEATQSWGHILTYFPSLVLKTSPYEGFSYYSKEGCHEFLHGEGSCTKYLARDDSCLGGNLVTTDNFRILPDPMKQ